MTTITNGTTLGVTLSSPTYIDPITVIEGILVSNNNGGAGLVAASGSWTVQNSGAISGYYGIFLNGGGLVTNEATASITGYGHGIAMINGTGTVINAGGIRSTGTLAAGYGVRFAFGGLISNAAGASIIGNFLGAQISGSVGTVINAGSIAGASLSGYGVRLASGGAVTNTVTASISGRYGIAISTRYNGQSGSGISGTIINYGSIVGSATLDLILGTGVILGAGGTITNGTSASIVGGGDGVEIKYDAGTIINFGTITGLTPNSFLHGGVVLHEGGSVTNATSSVIQGAEGVAAYDGIANVINYGTILGTGRAGAYLVTPDNTLTNAGTISGSNGTAVVLGGAGTNRLILHPGAAFAGLVVGVTSASNTLELASAASAGTLAGLGSQFTNFSSIMFDAGSHWFASGNTAGLAGNIGGFAAGDTIQVTGIAVTGWSFTDGTLTLYEAAGQASLNLSGDFQTSDFVVANGSTGADITIAESVPCFAAGTRIETERGLIAVERLRIGDQILTAAFEQRPTQQIQWIGTRHVDCTRHPFPERVWPICIAPHAFGAGRPSRSVLLSPDHSVFVEGVLIPIKYLINGLTVTQRQLREITYYHIELPRHDVVLAEGLPCESYLETGGRAAFANAGPVTALHADFTRDQARVAMIWKCFACAPLLGDSDQLGRARAKLQWQATHLDPRREGRRIAKP